MKPRSLIPIVVLFALLVSVGLFIGAKKNKAALNDKEGISIIIASIIEIQPIADLRTGFKESIANSSIASKVQYIERNAQGDPGLMEQIASEVGRTNPDLVYVLGTPLAQSIQSKAPEVILVQGAVTDPVEANLAESWAGSGRKYAANSDRPPVEELVILMRNLLPEAKTIGVLYNPGESNSVAVINDLKDAAPGASFVIREFGVGSATDLPAAITAAISTSDVIFVPPDNLVTAGLQSIIQTARNRGLAVFATTDDAITLGALGSVTLDFTELGRQAGRIALEIIVDGKDPSKMAIELPENARTVVNAKTARVLGVELSSERLGAAVVVE